MTRRTLYKKIWEKLSSYKNMVFVAGPRQSGKTTFTSEIGRRFSNRLYFNWDIIEDKKRLVENPYFFEGLNRTDAADPLIIFDEIHKYKDWKNYLKGVCDKFDHGYHFLVSGSGRLDVFQKGGDSLAGRYLMFYLWPFTLGELSHDRMGLNDFLLNPLSIGAPEKSDFEIWENLKRFSGFPEPFLKGQDDFYRIWSSTYRRQLLREDIRDLSQIKNIDVVETLFSLLPGRVGSLASLNHLALTLKVSYESVKNWMLLFERLFMIFFVSPWKKSVSRAIVKERKVYLFDCAHIVDDGIRFENMVALELFRAVSNWNDAGVGEFSLHFIRNKEKEEVDFLIAKQGVPFLLIEAKSNNANISKNLMKFQRQLNIPGIQLVDAKDVYRSVSNGKNKIMVVSGPVWLARLPWS